VKLKRSVSALRRKSYYVVQKTTGYKYDRGLEDRARARAAEALRGADPDATAPAALLEVELATLDVDNRDRYSVARGDVYRRFIAGDEGADVDQFGRKGTWVSRGCMLYVDKRDGSYLKIFEPHFSLNGEGRFLRAALDSGCYAHLTPGLQYLVVDADGTLRGYAIAAGEVLTPYEFERLIGHAYRDVVIDATKRTGFYFYDLAFHNVVRNGDELTFIDLESILPLEWYGTDANFAKSHLDDIDIGWPLQTKWHSPDWYREFLDSMTRNRIGTEESS
jgi:hypothetical protein